MTIKETQELLEAWVSKHPAARSKSDLALMASLTEEVGELARTIAMRHGDAEHDPEWKESMSDELGDVLWVIVSIANQHDIDLTDALIDNLEKKSGR